jgi:hypothetical protein
LLRCTAFLCPAHWTEVIFLVFTIGLCPGHFNTSDNITYDTGSASRIASLHRLSMTCTLDRSNLPCLKNVASFLSSQWCFFLVFTMMFLSCLYNAVSFMHVQSCGIVHQAPQETTQKSRAQGAAPDPQSLSLSMSEVTRQTASWRPTAAAITRLTLLMTEKKSCSPAKHQTTHPARTHVRKQEDEERGRTSRRECETSDSEISTFTEASAHGSVERGCSSQLVVSAPHASATTALTRCWPKPQDLLSRPHAQDVFVTPHTSTTSYDGLIIQEPLL